MKKYVKPTIEYIELRPEESIATTAPGDCSKHDAGRSGCNNSSLKGS